MTLPPNGSKTGLHDGGRGVIRGFVTGLVWGGVVGAAGLAVISQVAPLPVGPVAPVVTATAPEPAEPVDDSPEPVVNEPEPAPVNAPAPLPEAEAQPPAADPAPVASDVAEPPAAAPTTAPQALVQPEPAEDAAVTPQAGGDTLPAATPVPSVDPLKSETAPAGVEQPPEPTDEPLLGKAPAPSDQADAALPAEQPVGDAPRVIVPDGNPLTEKAATPDEATTAPPADPLEETPELPRVGDVAEGAEPVPDVATPLDLFARPFDNPDAKPLFSLVLIDDGAVDTDRETLAALPFAVTFVIDPLAPGAAEAAAIYRKAGQEVMMQTTGVPKGATAADIEQSYQALDMALPEAVAVLGASGLAEDSQQLAAAVVPIISAQGRGIVTMERGLNAVDQAARREGVPQATVFRILDASGESVPVIRRYLDRAAFRAAQEGSVVVLGSTRPDTIAAILQWTVEGRAASVALAPVSAILKAPK